MHIGCGPAKALWFRTLLKLAPLKTPSGSCWWMPDLGWAEHLAQSLSRPCVDAARLLLMNLAGACKAQPTVVPAVVKLVEEVDGTAGG